MKKQEFKEKRIEVAADITARGGEKAPIIHRLLPTSDPTVLCAYDYLKDDTIEMYRACEYQYTVHLMKDEGDDKRIQDILNDKGLKLYNEVLEKVQNEAFKDTFSEYCIERSNSGMWHSNNESRFYNENENGIHLNSFRNYKIRGFSQKLLGVLTTSCCVFYKEPDDTNEFGWCYTASGSLYKLLKCSSYDRIQSLIRTYNFGIRQAVAYTGESSD